MNKLRQLRRLDLLLAFKVLFIYFKKALRLSGGINDTVYLAYLYTLEHCDLRHVQEEADCFKVVTSDGIFLYLRKYPSSDAQVLYQIWTQKEYETITEHIKKNFSGRKLRIIDAGANVGYASVFMYSRLHDRYDLEFIIIEPSRENLTILEKNFRANNINHIHIEKAGLYNKSCFLDIRSDFRDGKEWSLRVEESVAETDLRGVEVLDILGKYSWDEIDFFKIDIEGAERHLFEDEGYAASFLRKSKLISIEVHEESIKVEKIRQALIDNHFDCFSHGEITIGHNQR